MFIININYIVPLEEIDAAMKEHMVFLNKYYKENKFVVSGRKVPRTGGIILALANSIEEIDAIMAKDPFCIRKLAEYTLTEFRTAQFHPDLRQLLK